MMNAIYSELWFLGFFFLFPFFHLLSKNAQSQTFTKDLKKGLRLLRYDSKASQDHNVLISMVRGPVVWFV